MSSFWHVLATLAVIAGPILIAWALIAYTARQRPRRRARGKIAPE